MTSREKVTESVDRGEIDLVLSVVVEGAGWVVVVVEEEEVPVEECFARGSLNEEVAAIRGKRP